jgi:hypothetical protein
MPGTSGGPCGTVGEVRVAVNVPRRRRLLAEVAHRPVLTNETQSPWFLNVLGKLKPFQRSFLHSSLVDGPPPRRNNRHISRQAQPGGRKYGQVLT